MKIDITIRDLSPEQAAIIAAAAKHTDTNHPAKPITAEAGLFVGVGGGGGGAASSPPGKVTTKEPEPEPAPAEAPRRGPPMPRVSSEAVAQAAAAAKKPETKKPETTKGGAKPKAEAAPPPEPEEEEAPEEEAPPPKKPAAASTKANGVNGHAKPAARAKEEEAPEEEEEEDAGEDIPAAVLEAKKLGDLLNALIDQGITDADDLKKECARLKPRIPLLQRITDLDGRIDRTLEVIERGEDQV